MNHEDWGEGPWNTEADDATWIDPETDLDCMIHRGPSGALCGYVGVPPSHPLHGTQYDDVRVEVHGGLTYSKPCQETGLICHVPEPGREHDIWWFGFDCAHFMDRAPGMDADMRKLNEQLVAEGKKPIDLEPIEGDPFLKTYRDWDYVKGEVHDLAVQLARLA